MATKGTSSIPSDDYVEEVEQTTSSGDSPKATPREGGIPTSTYWHYYDFDTRGRFKATAFPGRSRVNRDSQVAVSITQLDGSDIPFLGSAVMQVYNVVPGDDGKVIVLGDVHWSSSLRVRLNFIIFN